MRIDSGFVGKGSERNKATSCFKYPTAVDDNTVKLCVPHVLWGGECIGIITGAILSVEDGQYYHILYIQRMGNVMKYIQKVEDIQLYAQNQYSLCHD